MSFLNYSLEVSLLVPITKKGRRVDAVVTAPFEFGIEPFRTLKLRLSKSCVDANFKLTHLLIIYALKSDAYI